MTVVGVPKEVKSDEYRVAMLPVGVEELTHRGHRVLIQTGAGQGSGIPDEAYRAHGAEIGPGGLYGRTMTMRMTFSAVAMAASVSRRRHGL